MSAVIVGLPTSSTSSKVLRRQGYEKAINGLESITETYIVQTQNLLSIIPAKDTKHSDFSTATNKYQRMAVESISTSEQEGGLTELNVSYAGLTSSSGLPPAVVRIIPATGAGIFGPPVNIEAEFVSDLTEFQIVKGQYSSLTPYTPIDTPERITPVSGPKVLRMPRFINGTAMPDNPREPFVQQGTSSTGGFLYRYEGYISNNFQCTRRGQFLVCVVTFAEYAFSLVSVSGGWSNRFGS